MAWLGWGSVLFVVVFHLYAATLEMVLWETPLGRRTFGTEAAFAKASRALAANQGLYNLFLAAGLSWGLGWYGLVRGRPILVFFLLCVVVAGLFGGATVNRRIALVQALPAAVALGAVLAQ